VPLPPPQPLPFRIHIWRNQLFCVSSVLSTCTCNSAGRHHLSQHQAPSTVLSAKSPNFWTEHRNPTMGRNRGMWHFPSHQHLDCRSAGAGTQNPAAGAITHRVCRGCVSAKSTRGRNISVHDKRVPAPGPCNNPSRFADNRRVIKSSHLLPSSRHRNGIPSPRHLHHRPKAAPSTIVLFQNNHSNTCAPIPLFPLRPAHSEIWPVTRHQPHQLRARHHPTTPSMPFRPPQ
jgi:hypothetical protein